MTFPRLSRRISTLSTNRLHSIFFSRLPSWSSLYFTCSAASFNFFYFDLDRGDSGNGMSYPPVSPYVISVGRTTLPLDNAGNLVGSETAWQGSGGGVSSYVSEPTYQSSSPIPSTGGKRGGPDVSYNADPNTGVSVYDSTPYSGQKGWYAVGGTSAGSPQWAGLIALANQGRTAGNLSRTHLINAGEVKEHSQAA
jgi:subtilase family serine protease